MPLDLLSSPTAPTARVLPAALIETELPKPSPSSGFDAMTCERKSQDTDDPVTCRWKMNTVPACAGVPVATCSVTPGGAAGLAPGSLIANSEPSPLRLTE